MAVFFDDKFGGCSCARSECSDECSTYRSFKPKPQTNYDLLISKTPEELAIFCEDGCPPGAPICNSVETIKGETVKDHCQRCWLNWIKSPAEEVDE